MRVTPKTMVSPAAMRNSEEALASPLSACRRRNETLGKGRVSRAWSGGAARQGLGSQGLGNQREANPWRLLGLVERCALRPLGPGGFALLLARGPHVSFRD